MQKVYLHKELDNKHGRKWALKYYSMFRETYYKRGEKTYESVSQEN